LYEIKTVNVEKKDLLVISEGLITHERAVED